MLDLGERLSSSDDSFTGRRSGLGSSVLSLSEAAVLTGVLSLLSSMLFGKKKLSKIVATEATTIKSNTKWKFSGHPRPSA